MPKKLCCCGVTAPQVIVKPNWVAVPCVVYESATYKAEFGRQKIFYPPQLSTPSYYPYDSLVGWTFPYTIVEPNQAAFDLQREVLIMMRGAGGGAKPIQSGGNAAYTETIATNSKNWGTRPFFGGSGPDALDIHSIIDYESGAAGYPNAGWGGGANIFGDYFAIGEIGFSVVPYIAGGGGGAGSRIVLINGQPVGITATDGAHGGVLEGNRSEGNYSGSGGSQIAGGAAGGPFAFSGSYLRGGRGKDGPLPLSPVDYAGGGGGAGYYGGGGGDCGHAGGGGSSKVQDQFNPYNFDGTTFGPGSRCNPYFSRDYDPGLGANRDGRYIDGITFQTGTSGANAETAQYHRSKWCTCTETESEGKQVPVPNYICLTEEQANIIFAEANNLPELPEELDLDLSFVLNGVKYVLLYKCTIGCEPIYLEEGVPENVKYYYSKLSFSFIADYPQFNFENITSCCDCYLCLPVCSSSEKTECASCGEDRPCFCPPSYAPPIHSCGAQNGLTQYWAFDNETSYYYKCKVDNCWIKFGNRFIAENYNNERIITRYLEPLDLPEGFDPCERTDETCEDTCERTLAECYTLTDYYGVGQPITVNSTIKTCVPSYEGHYDECVQSRCESVSINATQVYRIGSYDSGCSIDDPEIPIPNCPNGRIQTVLNYYEGNGDCPYDINCCSSPPDLNWCAGSLITKESYQLTTCLFFTDDAELPDAERYDTRDVIYVYFPICMIKYILDDNSLTAEQKEEAIKALMQTKIKINLETVQVGINNEAGVVVTVEIPQLQICRAKINIFSANPGKIAETINSLLAGFVSAVGQNPFFWFGYRQSCFACPEKPNVRPPYIDGDSIFVDYDNIVVSLTQVRVPIKGTSLRRQCCVTQTVEHRSDYLFLGDIPTLSVTNTGVSENKLSLVEFSEGLRFDFEIFEQDLSVTEILSCGDFPTVTATECSNIPGMAACNGMKQTKAKCRCYWPYYPDIDCGQSFPPCIPETMQCITDVTDITLG